ncbi:hypothetical protein B4135_1644 [Caldibacillus debilis]|uniref:Uncharacterized protein n=1 Tax=Caldibacillus debilis TaxID=301148 RepID=A0A150MAQ1_9BACI|nr:hypothetical protein B4135_1644 [Caldibacillus debilis]
MEGSLPVIGMKRTCIPGKRFLWRTAKGAPSLGFPVPAYAVSWTKEEGK